MERDYTIPLRGVLKVSRFKRTPKAVKEIREFLQRHMKAKEVVIGQSLNQLVWKDGMTTTPNSVKVHTLRDKDGVVYAELPGTKIVTRAEAEKASEDKKVQREAAKKEKEREKEEKEATKTKEEKKAEQLDKKVTEVG